MLTPILRVNGLTKYIDHRVLWHDLTFTISKGERIGLVGDNGSGKSVLMRVLAGCDLGEGSLWTDSSVSVGYLPQDQGGQDDSHLSGGEKTRLAIGRLLAQKPDLLLLDEPTNHLDIDGLLWLERTLRQYRGTVLVISHDRDFLDTVTDRTLFLDRGELLDYPGGYSEFRRQYDESIAARLEQRRVQLEERKRMREFVARQMQWFEKAHRQAGKDDHLRRLAKKMAKRGKAYEKRMERFEGEIVAKPWEKDTMRIAFDPERSGGQEVLRLEGAAKSFGGRNLINGLDLVLTRGECLGVVGPNGCGKSTLVRMIMGQIPADAGLVWVNPVASVGYFSQETADRASGSRIIDEVMGAGNITETDARTILGCLSIRGEEPLKRVFDCSLGERVKVAIACLVAMRPTLLILDEPTNHLDISAREAIEGALEEYPGTVLVVSHDRYLLRRLARKLILFRDGPRVFPGGYEEALAFIERDTEGASSERVDRLSPQEIMLLRNRQAYLAGVLSDPKLDADRRQTFDAEYLEVSRTIANARSQR